MYALPDKSQFQANEIYNGRHKLAPVHQEIMDWITAQFGVRALDFYCETKKTPKGVQKQLIHVILEEVEDVKRMNAGSKDVVERFLKYFRSGNSFDDPLKSDVFPPDSNPYPEIIVTYRPLKVKAETLKEMFNDERSAILKTFEDVWTVSMAVVFYYTDAQLKENALNGTSAKINEALEQVEKKYGATSFSGYRFDSKESFDRDYESKWHYYWK